MHYNLLFNGCSYTEGMELEGPECDLNYQNTHRFSHIVAEKSGLSYCNIAKSGGSNESILRRTFEWFEQGNTCDHAIIQWTYRFRRDFFITDYKFINILPNIEIFEPKRSKYLQQISKIRKHHISIQDNSNDQYNQDMCMSWMKYFLKDKCSVFYLKLFKEPAVCSSYYNKSQYHKFISDIELHYIEGNILNPKNKFLYCNPIKNNFHLNGSHPNRFGHMKIANYILNNDNYFKNKL
jgi:hypothetical protein